MKIPQHHTETCLLSLLHICKIVHTGLQTNLFTATRQRKNCHSGPATLVRLSTAAFLLGKKKLFLRWQKLPTGKSFIWLFKTFFLSNEFWDFHTKSAIPKANQNFGCICGTEKTLWNSKSEKFEPTCSSIVCFFLATGGSRVLKLSELPFPYL